MAQDEEALFLDGRDLSGVTGDTRVDWSNLQTFGENVGAACARSPEAGLIDVAKIVGIR